MTDLKTFEDFEISSKMIANLGENMDEQENTTENTFKIKSISAQPTPEQLYEALNITADKADAAQLAADNIRISHNQLLENHNLLLANHNKLRKSVFFSWLLNALLIAAVVLIGFYTFTNINSVRNTQTEMNQKIEDNHQRQVEVNNLIATAVDEHSNQFADLNNELDFQRNTDKQTIGVLKDIVKEKK